MNVKNAVVIQHVAHEGPGSFEGELKTRGIKTSYVRVHRGEKIPKTIGEGSILMVMGGPMGVYEQSKYPFITEELRLTEYAFRNNVPTFGVCLGAQIMAHAAGADVYKGKTKEIGWSTVDITDQGKRDPLLVGLPSPMVVFQWHGDTFDLPKGSTLLASSGLYQCQLVRMGKFSYAMQFHLEVSEAMIEGWLKEEENIKEIKAAGVNPEDIRKETPLNIGLLKKHSSTVFSRFLRLV